MESGNKKVQRNKKEPVRRAKMREEFQFYCYCNDVPTFEV